MYDKPSQQSCLKCFVMKNQCEWAPDYDMPAKVIAPEVPESDSPSGCHASIEVQHEANAIHQAELELTEQLVVASEQTAVVAHEMLA